MAIIIGGKSECKICGEVMNSNREIVAFPPIISNANDSLIMFHDAGFHAHCFRSHPLADRMNRIMAQAMERTENYPCFVCKQPMHYSDDFVSLGLLSSDPEHPLFQFNYLLFHREHLRLWSELQWVYDIVSSFSADQWGGKGAEHVLATLANALKQ